MGEWSGENLLYNVVLGSRKNSQKRFMCDDMLRLYMHMIIQLPYDQERGILKNLVHIVASVYWCFLCPQLTLVLFILLQIILINQSIRNKKYNYLHKDSLNVTRFLIINFCPFIKENPHSAGN